MPDKTIIQTWLERARGFASGKRHLHALQLYQRITSADPDHEQAWVEMAQIFLQLKRTDAAERALQHALGLSRNPTQILYALAMLHRESENTYEASRYFRRLLALKEKLPQGMRTQLHADLGGVYLERKNARMAEHHFRTAFRLDPGFPRVAEELAALLLQRGAITEAAKYLRNALTSNPTSWDARYLLGKIYARKGEWSAAMEAFSIVVELNPEEPRGWHMCGATLLAMHRLEECEPYLQKAVALDPRFVDALVDLGLLFVRKGDRPHAKELFFRALKEEPGNRRARDGQRELLRMRNAQ